MKHSHHSREYRVPLIARSAIMARMRCDEPNELERSDSEPLALCLASAELSFDDYIERVSVHAHED